MREHHAERGDHRVEVVVREGQGLGVADSKVDARAELPCGLDYFGAQVDTGYDGAAGCDTARRPARARRDVENALAGLGVERVDGVLDGVRDSSTDFIILLAPSSPRAGSFSVGW